jgi:hypothetical protein
MQYRNELARRIGLRIDHNHLTKGVNSPFTDKFGNYYKIDTLSFMCTPYETFSLLVVNTVFGFILDAVVIAMAIQENIRHEKLKSNSTGVSLCQVIGWNILLALIFAIAALISRITNILGTMYEVGKYVAKECGDGAQKIQESIKKSSIFAISARVDTKAEHDSVIDERTGLDKV